MRSKAKIGPGVGAKGKWLKVGARAEALAEAQIETWAGAGHRKARVEATAEATAEPKARERRPAQPCRGSESQPVSEKPNANPEVAEEAARRPAGGFSFSAAIMFTSVI